MSVQMKPDALRAFLLFAPDGEDQVRDIEKLLGRYGVESVLPNYEFVDSGSGPGDIFAMLENIDAIVLFVGQSTFAKRDLEFLMRDQPIEFESLLQNASGKFMLVMLQHLDIPDSLASMPSFPYFEQSDSDIKSSVERLAYFIRESVEMRRSVEQQMPQESLKTTTPGPPPPGATEEAPLAPEVETIAQAPPPPGATEEAPLAPEVETTEEAPPPPGATEEAPLAPEVETTEQAPPAPEATEEAPESSSEADEVPPPKPAKTDVSPYPAIALVFAIIGFGFLGYYINRSVPELTNGVMYHENYAVEFLLMQPQSFLMGSQSTDSLVDERPAHNVEFQSPFLIGTQEITNKLYADFILATDARHGPADPFADDSRATWPVVNVSFNDVQAFTRWFSTVSDGTYRLPTEAEWEWVAQQSASVSKDRCSYINYRGGALDASLLGSTNNLRGKDTGSDYTCSGASPVLIAVDELDQDEMGLYNLFGNAAEWVQDCYSSNYLGAPDDGSAYESGDCNYRVFRGGSWLSPGTLLSPRLRSYAPADYRDFHLGFRLVRDLDWLDAFVMARSAANWNQLLPLIAYAAYAAALLSLAAFVWLVRRGGNPAVVPPQDKKGQNQQKNQQQQQQQQ